MKTLFAYEVKKLLNRRVLWVALVLCAALQTLNCYGDIRLALGGAVAGLREVYARYEGQTITEDLKAQLLSDYREYAAAHPEEFKPSTMDIGYWALDEQVWRRRHGYGVMQAYQNLLYAQTQADVQSAWQAAHDELAAGVDADGNPLNPDRRLMDMQLTALPAFVPVVHYDLGWAMGGDPQGLVTSAMQRVGVPTVGYTPLGVLLVLLLLMSGLPGFPGERSARMEPMLLTGARRKPATIAKLVAVVVVITAAVLALSLLELALRAATLGLNGWYLPSSPYGMGASYLTAWIVATLGLMLGCAAGVLLITAVSALVRGIAAALGLAAAVLAAQYALWELAQMEYLRGMHDMWITALYKVTSSFPLNVINCKGIPYGFSPSAIEMSLLFALPLALCAACLWLGPRVYLRRRRA